MCHRGGCLATSPFRVWPLAAVTSLPVFDNEGHWGRSVKTIFTIRIILAFRFPFNVVLEPTRLVHALVRGGPQSRQGLREGHVHAVIWFRFLQGFNCWVEQQVEEWKCLGRTDHISNLAMADVSSAPAIG